MFPSAALRDRHTEAGQGWRPSFQALNVGCDRPDRWCHVTVASRAATTLRFDRSPRSDTPPWCLPNPGKLAGCSRPLHRRSAQASCGISCQDAHLRTRSRQGQPTRRLWPAESQSSLQRRGVSYGLQPPSFERSVIVPRALLGFRAGKDRYIRAAIRVEIFNYIAPVIRLGNI